MNIRVYAQVLVVANVLPERKSMNSAEKGYQRILWITMLMF